MYRASRGTVWLLSGGLVSRSNGFCRVAFVCRLSLENAVLSARFCVWSSRNCWGVRSVEMLQVHGVVGDRVAKRSAVCSSKSISASSSPVYGFHGNADLEKALMCPRERYRDRVCVSCGKGDYG